MRPVADQFYGDRSGMIADPFGHSWFVATLKEQVAPAEMQRRWDAALQQRGRGRLSAGAPAGRRCPPPRRGAWRWRRRASPAAAPGRAGGPCGPAAPDRAAGAAADRFGQRRGPLALPAAVLAPRALPARAAGRARLCRPAAPAVRVLGPRGLAAAGGGAAAAALAHGSAPAPARASTAASPGSRASGAATSTPCWRRCARAGRWRPASSPRAAAGEGGWWGWSDGKLALEFLFWAGLVTTATRRGFERVYDLPERALPRAVLDAPTPEPAEAQRELLRRAARALGVATARDLRDYFRLDAADVPARHRRAGRGRRAAAGRGRGLGAAGLARPGGAPAAPGRRARAAVAVRFPGLGARAHRAAVRLPLPAGDLHARRTSASTATTCCRSCWATGWWPASTCAATARRAACACWRPTSSRASTERVGRRGRWREELRPAGRLARPGARRTSRASREAK